jgi:hypothetical protein
MAESTGARSAQAERLGGAGFARGSRRTGWGAHFISYDSTKWGHVVKKNIFLVSYSFERIAKLLEERELRRTSTRRTRRHGLYCVKEVFCAAKTQA